MSQSLNQLIDQWANHSINWLINHDQAWLQPWRWRQQWRRKARWQPKNEECKTMKHEKCKKRIKGRTCIKNFGFALRLKTFVQKFLTWGHNPQPQPQTQPSDHGSWICILRWRRRGLRPLGSDHKMQIQDPWSNGCVCHSLWLWIVPSGEELLHKSSLCKSS